MSIAQLLASEHRTAFSFEILPPLRGKGIESTFSQIDRLMPFAPAYINITTHRTDTIYRQNADGSFERAQDIRRPGTTAVATAVMMRYGLPTVPHVICADNTAFELENELIDLSYLGITDLLLLRGDRARGENRFVPKEGGHAHALDLVRQVTDFNEGRMLGDTVVEPLAVPFSFGVAGYPEKHEEAMNPDEDLKWLKAKVEAGAEYVVTQMFYDNRKYFDFVQRAREAGITVPIIPGLKPLTALTQQFLLPKTFHIDLPEDLSREFLKCKTNDDAKALGVEWGIQQARELREANVPSIHFYSMNASKSVEKIAQAVY